MKRFHPNQWFKSCVLPSKTLFPSNSLLFKHLWHVMIQLAIHQTQNLCPIVSISWELQRFQIHCTADLFLSKYTFRMTSQRAAVTLQDTHVK